MRILSYIPYTIIGYLVGLWLAAPGLFSWTLAATQWGNLMVYVYLLFWPFILMWTFFLWALLIAAVIFVIVIFARS